MIISGKQLQGVMQLYKEQSAATTKADKILKSSTVSSAPDEVILSSQGQEFSQVYKTLKALPDVRQDKVDELSAQIEAGTYNVSGQDIAEKMLANLAFDRTLS